MYFQNPWGALGFLLIPLLILLYLLKQRYRQEKVPSTYLWQKAANQWEASHPWQKWRKSLLFFLQLVILTSLIVAFMHPVWKSQGMGENTVLVVDLSLSMQAKEKDKSRLDLVKEEINEMIDGMQSGEEMSIVLAGHQNELLTMKSSNKSELKSQINKVTAQYGGNALVEAIQLAKSIQSDDENEIIYLFTDQSLPQSDDKVVVRNVAEGAPNMAISSLSYAKNSADNTLSVLGMVRNYAEAETATVELWCDGELVDVKDVDFKEEAQVNVIFEGVNPEAKRLMMALSEEDALMEDNYVYGVVQDDKSYKVLLQTEQNVFLEKAIFLREDIELYKSSPSEELPLEEYDLIIGDSWKKDTLPEGQGLWLINPEVGNEWIDIEEAEVGTLSVSNTELAQNLFTHVDLSNVAFAELRGLDRKDPTALPLVYNGDSVLVLAQESAVGKRLAFGFDFHNSNLPMMKDFPILVQNILNWFMPVKEGKTTQIIAHQAMPVSLRQETSSYKVILPDQTEIKDQQQQQFINTRLPGFYRILQQDALGETLSELDFAVNADSGAAESNLYTASREEDSRSDELGNGFQRNSMLLPVLAILALLIMLVEWWVYHRGN